MHSTARKETLENDQEAGEARVTAVMDRLAKSQ